MKKITRRQALIGIAAGAVTLPAATRLPCGLKELPIPYAEFDNGEIANADELLAGIPFKTKADLPSSNYPNSRNFVRERRVFVRKETPVRSHVGICYGWMTLSETLYGSYYCDKYQWWLTYKWDKCQDSQEFTIGNEWGYDEDNIVARHVSQALKDTGMSLPQPQKRKRKRPS